MSLVEIPCSVYRSPKREGMYLYVPKNEPFANVPDDLLVRFGTPGHVMDLQLTPEHKLARVSAQDVLRGLRDQGYFLQMPPSEYHN